MFLMQTKLIDMKSVKKAAKKRLSDILGVGTFGSSVLCIE